MTGDSTRSVHAGSHRHGKQGPVEEPIFQTSTFAFEKATEVVRAVKGQSGASVYTRWGNPTVDRLEDQLAELEGGEECAFFSSGMAAISTAVISSVQSGDHVLATRDLYGESYKLIHDFLPGFGVETTMVEALNPSELKDGVRKNTKVVYVETPTNPTLKLVDVARAADVAHRVGANLFVDSTFGSPINQRPLGLGADIVLHSATKYLNGHADVIAGAAVGSKELVGRIKMARRMFGGTLDPHAAFLILRGLKTLAIRVKKQNSSAQRLAEYLSTHPKVSRVHYPGLKSHPQHKLASKQMKGYGGMLSFEIKGKMRDAMRFTESLELAILAASLGGVETLVAQPATLTHTQLSPKERKRTGISETLIRVSVGIEDSADLIADFEQALSKV